MAAKANQYHRLIAEAIKDRDPSLGQALKRARIDDTIALLARAGRVTPATMRRRVSRSRST